MKIPETSANVGAYYGNEENGQWQPNGIIVTVDNGVGGGVVGSGDAGVHRPPVYPVHIPRGHIPGYVMAGAFYPPAPYGVPPAAAAPQDDFEDYMWMENEEEFDKQVMQQLEEEALMEQCIEAMLEDEQRERRRPMTNGHKHYPTPTTSNGNPLSLEETVSRSTLNPLAAEFVPTCARLPPPPPTDERQEATAESAATATEVAKSTEEPPGIEPAPQPTADEPPAHTEVPEPPTQTETPEVSAADVPVSTEKDRRPTKDRDGSKKDPKEPKRMTEPKKTVKPEQKAKPKPQPAKAESKVQPKKKEAIKSVKAEVKGETKAEEKVEEAPAMASAPAPAPVENAKPQPPAEEPIAPGIKPINYAAAAKATKPKKPTTPPIVAEKTLPPTKTEKKVEKPVQRKNSAK